jgi:hypothetical protein
MPNHITNVITVEGTTIQKIMDVCGTMETGREGEYITFDFNKIIPMPEALLNTESVSYPNASDKKEAHEAKVLANIENYGYADWYGFACAEWGTKWNAYDVNIEDDSIQFDTAWATPEPVIARLSTMFPDATITVNFADEDVGYNCGIYAYRNGERVSYTDMTVSAVGEETAINFAGLLKYGDSNYFAEIMAEREADREEEA